MLTGVFLPANAGRFMRRPTSDMQVASTWPLPMGSPFPASAGVVEPLGVVLEVGDAVVHGALVCDADVLEARGAQLTENFVARRRCRSAARASSFR